ncbi:MAG TPA: hypothetical protein V6D03_15855, partial [Candidatus Caenarcaniphilales bacterium]
MTDELTAQSPVSELVPAPIDPPCPITQSIAKLRQLTQVDVLSSWRCWSGVTSPPAVGSSCWIPVELNARNHIAWEAGQQVLWLEQQFEIPVALQGYPLT